MNCISSSNAKLRGSVITLDGSTLLFFTPQHTILFDIMQVACKKTKKANDKNRFLHLGYKYIDK